MPSYIFSCSFKRAAVIMPSAASFQFAWSFLIASESEPFDASLSKCRCRNARSFFAALTMRPTRAYVMLCLNALLARSVTPTISACATDVTSAADSSFSFFLRRFDMY